MRLLAGLVTMLILAGCGHPQASAPAAPPTTLTVFGAASLTESMQDIGAKFQAANPDITVQFNFAGSQDLLAQMENGADADVFASANESLMDKAWKEFLVKPESIHDFAGNRLVIVVPKTNSANVAQIGDLARPGLKIVVADESVPVGKYTQQMVDQMSKDPQFGTAFKNGFTANIVSREENVKSVLSKVRLGEADAGVVYVTDMTADAAKDVHPDAAQKFEDFVLSDPGQQILHQYNFLPAASNGH
jgi:molybdate transport system substrate-binding protein